MIVSSNIIFLLEDDEPEYIDTDHESKDLLEEAWPLLPIKVQ